MSCFRCNTPNELGSNFCRHCGVDLHTGTEQKTNSKIPDTLLIIFVSLSAVGGVVQFVLQKFAPDWFNSPAKYIQGVFWIFQNLSFILIPLAIKNKILKIVGICITVPVILYWLYSNVTFMLR